MNSCKAGYAPPSPLQIFVQDRVDQRLIGHALLRRIRLEPHQIALWNRDRNPSPLAVQRALCRLLPQYALAKSSMLLAETQPSSSLRATISWSSASESGRDFLLISPLHILLRRLAAGKHCLQEHPLLLLHRRVGKSQPIASRTTPAATTRAAARRPAQGRSPKKNRPMRAAITTLDSRTADTAPIGAMVLAKSTVP